MRFIDDRNDPDFWTKNHYPENEISLAGEGSVSEANRGSGRQPKNSPKMISLAGDGSISEPERQTTDDKRKSSNPYSLFQQVKSPRHQPSPTPEDLFPPNSLIVLAGQPKIGKTTIAVALAKAIATGKPFAGKPNQQQAVGYISFDDSPAEIRQTFAKHADITDQTPIYLCTDMAPINTLDAQMQIEDFLIEHQGKATVIIDSFHAALTPEARTNDARAMRKLLTPLKRISERAGRIILIHHTNAYGTRIADHTQLQASVSQTIVMTYRPLGSNRLITWDSKGRGRGATQTLSMLSLGETSFKPYIADPLQSLNPRNVSTRPILEALRTKPQTIADLAELTGLKAKRIYKRLACLTANGHVHKVGNLYLAS